MVQSREAMLATPEIKFAPVNLALVSIDDTMLINREGGSAPVLDARMMFR